ncbi:MAG TPA: class I SAM-dependent methyltransferase [Acidimicrobiales bacterium]|nr:class I SAM-dependent methyltransferase [Acidimicrobiales bacterium]
MASTTGEDGEVAATSRYPLCNADEREGQRLSLLQKLGDPITVRWFERLGVGPGWRCVELGAGGGSIAEWLSDCVGPTGRVTAVDRDTSLLEPLAASRANVEVVKGDLCELELPESRFDLVHSRSVLMHVPCSDRVLEQAVRCLAPGGRVFFEETDGAPGQELSDAPEPYRAVFGPILARWTWARSIADTLRRLGLADVEDDVRQDPLEGGTDKSEFWKFTLGSVAELQEKALSSEERAAELRSQGLDPGELLRELPAMLALLDDPGFSVPFTARHRVTGRRPA